MFLCTGCFTLWREGCRWNFQEGCHPGHLAACVSAVLLVPAAHSEWRRSCDEGGHPEADCVDEVLPHARHRNLRRRWREVPGDGESFDPIDMVFVTKCTSVYTTPEEIFAKSSQSM